MTIEAACERVLVVCLEAREASCRTACCCAEAALRVATAAVGRLRFDGFDFEGGG